MTDREQLVDYWIKRAVQTYGTSEHALKLFCARASFVVGRYEEGATRAIANGIRRDSSSVQNHAHAHRLYATLRNSPLRSCIRSLWRTLPASHWWLAWEIDKAGYDALHYLDNAAKHGWSGREMMANYKADREAGNAPMVFRRGVIAVRGLVSELLTKHNGSLSKNLRFALANVLEIIESEMKS